MQKILVINDDNESCELLKEYLSPEGFEVNIANNGLSGIEHAVGEDCDLIVLDVKVPESNGFDALRQLRGRVATPIVILTARGDDVDRIIGLELGADDCLSKPFNPRELLARIRAVLRRVKPDREDGEPFFSSKKRLQVGDVEMDLGTRVVCCSGQQVELTAAEFNLLENMLRNAGELVTRENLIQVVLGRCLTPYDRSIDVHVCKLRKKLGNDMAGLERIKTIRGVGYLYALTPRTRGDR
ncbi:MAG TPA: response regulator transcription factor [Candidatus Aquicultor sp.]|jgi:two-component system response regulator CpxR